MNNTTSIPQYHGLRIAGYALEHGGADTSGDKVGAYAWDDNPNKWWVYDPVKKTVCNASGACLDNYNSNSGNDSSAIKAYGFNGSPNMQWNVTDGRLINVGSGKCLEHDGGYTKDHRVGVYPCDTDHSKYWENVYVTDDPNNDKSGTLFNARNSFCFKNENGTFPNINNPQCIQRCVRMGNTSSGSLYDKCNGANWQSVYCKGDVLAGSDPGGVCSRWSVSSPIEYNAAVQEYCSGEKLVNPPSDSNGVCLKWCINNPKCTAKRIDYCSGKYNALLDTANAIKNAHPSAGIPAGYVAPTPYVPPIQPNCVIM